MSLNIVKLAIENRFDVIIPASISITFLAWLSWKRGEKISIIFLLIWGVAILAMSASNPSKNIGLYLDVLYLFIIILISKMENFSAEVIILSICIPALFVTYMYNFLIFNHSLIKSVVEILPEFHYYLTIYNNGLIFHNFGYYLIVFFIVSGLTSFWYLIITLGILIKIFIFKKKKMSRLAVFMLAILVFVTGFMRLAGYSVYEYSEEYGVVDILH